MIGQSLTRSEKLLVLLFLLTLPLANPWVRGDGVGYYSYARSILLDGDLHFENDYLAAPPSFADFRRGDDGRLLPGAFTETGYVHNNHSIGPALLWLPWLALAHLAVLAARALGSAIPADGYSWPYLVTMALATAGYGFAGLWLAFRLARRLYSETWAALATAAVWLASSLPVYMYFNPSWSHAHSVFAVALFLWYWQRTRESRTLGQWVVLGLIAGLMANIYYLNALVLLLPLFQSLAQYWRYLSDGRDWPAAGRLFARNAAFAAVALLAFLPTLVSRWIIYGHPLSTGYPGLSQWNWSSPVLWEILFSSNHGMLSWTPILIPAVAGLFLLYRRDALLGVAFPVIFLVYYYVVASYYSWHGMASFGNRFFISLTPLFIFGLAAVMERAAAWFARPARALAALGAIAALLVVWNLAFIFQWGTGLIPARGPISWREMARNQVIVVPQRLAGKLGHYLFRRGTMMREIDQQDVARRRQALEERDH
jgi:hypothetical protein